MTRWPENTHYRIRPTHLVDDARPCVAPRSIGKRRLAKRFKCPGCGCLGWLVLEGIRKADATNGWTWAWLVRIVHNMSCECLRSGPPEITGSPGVDSSA